ncbi:hypothetical protein BKA69DRAFT_663525 [Paraphysoderma sedebokerense]|nr:hypothetical protein BKA69DRAFT_663525 [Paraphysoderma sedebokerense]
MMTDSLDLFEESHALFGDVQFAHGSPDAEFRYQLRHLTRPPCSGGGQMNQLKAKQVNQNGGINELRLTLANVNTEDSIKLMSHYVWNSALLMAHLIEAGEIEVQHKSVCELGAGAGLPSILSAIYGAEKVCITDYPDEVIIRNLRRNCDANLSSSPRTNCAICPFRWGDSVPEPLRQLTSSFWPTHFGCLISMTCY